MGEKLRVLDLFSGIGGFSLGLERTGGFEAVAFCEIDPFCRRVLAKHWPNVRQYEDVRELTAKQLRADGIIPDVICGGFPCQDIASNGPRTGIDGRKSNLWFDMLRVIREVRPQHIIVENVADLLGRGLGVVLGGLASSGYDAEWHCVPASFVGLPQARERVWVVAYPDSFRFGAGDQRLSCGSKVIRWLNDDRLGEGQARAQESTDRAWRVDDGVPRWMDRMHALGNALAPQIPEIIGRAILQAQAA